MGWNQKVMDQQDLGQQTRNSFQKIVSTNSQDRVDCGINLLTTNVGGQLFL